MKYLRDTAHKAGRNPDHIELTLRWNAVPPLATSSEVEEMAQRLRRYREVGVRHICFDLNIPRPASLPAMLETMEGLSQKVVPRL